jgi:hypothetical protein
LLSWDSIYVGLLSALNEMSFGYSPYILDAGLALTPTIDDAIFECNWVGVRYDTRHGFG